MQHKVLILSIPRGLLNAMLFTECQNYRKLWQIILYWTIKETCIAQYSFKGLSYYCIFPDGWFNLVTGRLPYETPTNRIVIAHLSVQVYLFTEYLKLFFCEQLICQKCDFFWTWPNLFTDSSRIQEIISIEEKGDFFFFPKHNVKTFHNDVFWTKYFGRMTCLTLTAKVEVWVAECQICSTV